MDYPHMDIEKEASEDIRAVIRYNLSESAISDQTLRSLNISIPTELVLTYTEHKGSNRIRSSVASASTGALTPDDILVTTGTSTSLFIVATALLSPHDHLIITAPIDATNLETPRAIGCDMTTIDLQFESQYRLSITDVANAIRPGQTKLISLCSPNSPTGTVIPPTQMRELAALAQTHGCYLLVDETYLDLTYLENDSPPLMAASLGPHVIGISSMSKTYGVPGIRVR